MVFYILVMLTSVVITYISETTNKENGYGKIAFTIVFFLMATPLFIRFNIGIDYANYKPLIDAYLLGYDNLGEIYQYDPHWDILIMLSIKLVRLFSKNTQIVFILWAGITMFFALRSIYKYSTMPYVSLLCYFLMGFYFMSMNVMRQSIALSILMNLVPFFNNKKNSFLEYLVIVLIASGFHSSSIIMVFVYFLRNKKLNISGLYVKDAIVVFFLFVAKRFVYMLAALTPFGNYLHHSYYGVINFSLTNLIIESSFFAIIYFVYRNAKCNEEEYFYINMFNLMFIATLSGLFLPNIIFRIKYYLDVYMVFFVPLVIARIENHNKQFLACCLLLAIGVFRFYMSAIGNGVIPFTILPSLWS